MRRVSKHPVPFSFSLFILRPLKAPRLETFDFDSAHQQRRRTAFHFYIQKQMKSRTRKFLIRLMHTEYLSFPN